MKNSAKDIPKIKEFRSIEFPEFTKITLSNGVPVYILPSNEYEVLKIEINLKAGRFFEKQKGVARACSNQIKEGTFSKNSETVATTIDFHGATLHSSGGMDFARVELYALHKHLPDLLPLVHEILTQPSFPEAELENYIKINKERLSIDLAKNEIVAYRKVTELLFGKDHPYGYNSDHETISSLTTERLKQHFSDHFKNASFSIIVAGKVEDETIQLIEQYFGKSRFLPSKKIPLIKKVVSESDDLFIQGKQKYQSTIRLGRELFDRTHKDYPGIYVLNTILGGYFGSRLMQNIREEKGLTYDIYSTLDMLWKDGYLMIGAEVDNENIDLTLSEIHKEFSKMRNTLVDQRELNLVKNYINGNLLNLLNGPFNSIELLRLIAVHEHEKSFFDNFIDCIRTIDTKMIQELASKYLNVNEFKQVIVGSKN